MRTLEKVLLDILEDAYPEEMEIKVLSQLTGASRPEIARAAGNMKDRGWVEHWKTRDKVFYRLKK